MSPFVRKAALAIHLAVSVGWIGAAAAYLALAIRAMSNPQAAIIRSSWSTFAFLGWYVLVPLALLTLATGLLMAAGTRWGVLHHYWVVISLLLTVLAVAVLVSHMGDVTARMQATATGSADPAGLASEVLHSGLGLLVLLVVHTLNVYKPRGLTRLGWRAQERRKGAESGGRVPPA